MDETEQARFRILFKCKFSNDLKAVNDALERHFEIIERKKETNKRAYLKNKENNDFQQKRKTTTNNTTTNINKNY